MFQAEPPTIIVATIASLCQMLEKHIFKLEAMQVLVIDEVIPLSSLLMLSEMSSEVSFLTFSELNISGSGVKSKFPYCMILLYVVRPVNKQSFIFE